MCNRHTSHKNLDRAKQPIDREMVLQASSWDDALDQWVEHGSHYAARCSRLASSVRAAHDVALESIRSIPPLSIPDVYHTAGDERRPSPVLNPCRQLQSDKFHHASQSVYSGAAKRRDQNDSRIACDEHYLGKQSADVKELPVRALLRSARSHSELIEKPLSKVNPPERATLRALRKRYRHQLHVEEQARQVAESENRKAQDLGGSSKSGEGGRQSYRHPIDSLRPGLHVAPDLTPADSASGAKASGDKPDPALLSQFQDLQPKPKSSGCDDVPHLNLQKVKANLLQETTDHSAAPAVKKLTSSPQAPPLKSPTSDSLPSHVSDVGRIWSQVAAESDAFRLDANLKRPRLLLKKRINLAANQIAASMKSVCTKIGDLVETLNQANSSGIRSALSFTMKEISDRLVAEGGGTVALSRPAAFAVASVIVGISAHSPDPSVMRHVVMGAFFDKCAYTVPTYVLRHRNETEQSFRSRLSFLMDESPDAYVERMCGYVSLYAAILQTREVLGPHGPTQLANPFPPSDAWGWLARAVNGPQRWITPDIVHAFLVVAGFELSRMYGSNFGRLLASVRNECVGNAAKAARPGAKSRIEGFVEDYFKSHAKISAPPGKYLPASDAENTA